MPDAELPTSPVVEPTDAEGSVIPATATTPVLTADPRAVAVPVSVGAIRETGTCMLLAIVTLGIYPIVWFYKTHAEMKQHTGQGLGGGLALVLSLFVGIVMPFVTASEVGGLYRRRGQPAPVSGKTGLWYLLLAWAFFVGPIVWFVKTNGALNAYWRSVGAR